MADAPLERTTAAAAYAAARNNPLRRYPAPERDGARLYPLASPSAKPSFRLERTDRVFTIGSCFARNVESALQDAGMTVISNETDLGPVGDSLGNAANFFNKYSIHSILNDLTWALERDSYPGDDILYPLPRGGSYADLQLGMAKLDAPLEQIRDFRSRYLDVMARAAEAEVVILTLGYVETWYDRRLGLYLNGSPPQPLVQEDPDRFEFRVLSYQDVLDALHAVHALLCRHRDTPPKMLVTVSPVPLLATFRDMDVLVANTYSKSVQRAALEAFVARTEGVDYFPSYEFVMLSNPAVAWSRGDYRHVSPDLVARIMSNVIARYVEGTDGAAMTPEALLASARMLFKTEDYAALDSLAAANADLVQGSSEMLVLLGNAALRRRNAEAACARFEEAHAVAPADRGALERLISVCRPLKRTARLGELLEVHAGLFPNRTAFRANFVPKE